MSHTLELPGFLLKNLNDVLLLIKDSLKQLYLSGHCTKLVCNFIRTLLYNFVDVYDCTNGFCFLAELECLLCLVEVALQLVDRAQDRSLRIAFKRVLKYPRQL